MPKVGRFGPPPLASVRLGPGGSGPVGLVPAGVWAAVPWHRIDGTVPGSVAPWFPLAGSSTGCCGTAGSPRVRNLAQPARSQRFASRLTYLAQVSDRWRAQGAKQALGGALAPLLGSAGALPAVDPPPPSRWVGVAHPQRIVVGGGGGPARRARPAPVWPWVRVSLPVGPPGSGVGIWLRTLGAFVAPRVG